MKMRSVFIPAMLLLVLFAASAFAQTQARVTSIVSAKNQVQASARLHLLCNGATYYDLQAAQMQITDNGMPVGNYSIWNAASAQTRKPFKAMLVLDLSGSMMGPGLAGLKLAAKALVSFMDPATDSLGIITFNTTAALRRPLTNDTATLAAVIDSFYAAGATAAWDAAYIGVQYIDALLDTASHAVVLMTDGGDNSSSRTPAQLIAAANAGNERIFTIGLGSGVQTQQLQDIATLTGGQFYQTPSAAELATIFLQIASFARRDYDEYTIRFDTPDRQAEQHTLAVSVRLCDTIVVASATRPSGPAVTGIEAAIVPARLTLLPVAPNPVTGGVLRVGYAVDDVAAEGSVDIAMYDALGRLCAQLRRAPSAPGEHAVSLRVSGLPSGMYQIEATLGRESRSAKVFIAR